MVEQSNQKISTAEDAGVRSSATLFDRTSIESELKTISICRRNNLILSDAQIEKLREYVHFLLEWNSKINLISRSDTMNIWFSHILHSLSILFFVDFPKNASVLDLGTGGGLPGIPMAIAREDLNVTLVDSIRKKTTAVDDIISRLKLANARVITGRAEEIAKQQFKGSFDIVIARAVAPLNDLIKWSKPLVKRVSTDFPKLVTLKGGELDDEIREAQIKSKPADIKTINMVFDGSEEIGLEGKKIVAAYY